MRTTILLALALLSLNACMAPVKKVAYQDAAPVPENAHPAPFRLSNILLRLPLGHTIGNYGTEALDLFCMGGFEAESNILRVNIDPPSARKAFYQTMASLGYDVTGSEEFLFEEEADDDWLRTEFKVGAKITNARMDACYQDRGMLESVFSRNYGDKGKLYLEVEWSIYDSLRKTTVYKVTTEGYVNRKKANYDGLALMFNDAFAMATHNLAADPAFHDLMVNGKRPPREQWQQKKKDHVEGRRKFDAKEEVTITNPPLSQQPITQGMENTRKIAVMIEGGVGHGSGFFITRQGHILTNSHVVGDALRVRVVSADKEEKMIAEVLRRDPARDVALLKLEEIPPDLTMTTVPVQTTWPGIGSDVYAIGAPMAIQLQDTVTRGIVSAHRRNFKIVGVKQNFIQADIEIHGGNSGGPLLDAQGNLVGISAAGYNEGDASTGLNVFIPVDEALKTLNITLSNNEKTQGTIKR